MIIWWYIGLQILALAVTPLCWLTFFRLRDRGWGFAKSFGILLTIYPTWLLAHAAPVYGRALLLLTLLALLAANVFIVVKRKEAFRSFLQANLRRILITEGVFLAAFIGFALVRSYQSDLSPKVQGYGSEKFMDIQFVNGIRLSSEFPPQDPWLGGKPVNYYYYGYYTCAALSDLLGIPTRYSYNLSIITIATLTFLNVFVLAWQLSRRVWAGLLAAMLVMVCGNQKAFFWSGVFETTTLERWFSSTDINARDFDGIPYIWTCSRVIDPPGDGSTINEVPYFSFMWGDLHGHLSALPFAVLVTGCALAVWPAPGCLAVTLLGIFLTALAYGSTIATNPWDLPTYAFMLLATALAFWRGDGSPRLPGRDTRNFLLGMASRLAIIIGGLMLVLPFALHFVSPKSGLNWDITHKSPMEQFLLLFGLQLWLVLVLVAVMLAGWLRRRPWQSLLVCAVALLAGWLLWWFSGVHSVIDTGKPWSRLAEYFRRDPRPELNAFLLPGLLGTLLVLLAWEKIRLCWCPAVVEEPEQSVFVTEHDTGRDFMSGVFVFALVAVSLCVWLGCEFVAIPDFYGKSNERMNTLFKFYYPAWGFLGIASAWILVRLAGWVADLWRSRGAAHRGLLNTRSALAALGLLGFAVMFVFACWFPVRATWLRSNKLRYPDDRTRLRPTLDGLAYMTLPQYQHDYHPGDYAAITWLQDNWEPRADGSLPLLAETSTNETYCYNSRFGTYTGLPTMLGWGNHEGIWRDWQKEDGTRRTEQEPSMRAEINRRRDAIKTIFESTCMGQAKPLLDQYSIDYVIVGQNEVDNFGAYGLEKFDRYMHRVWPPAEENDPVSNDLTRIYRGYVDGIDELLKDEVCAERPPSDPTVAAIAYTPILTIGSPGTAQGQFQEARGLALDAQGQLYVADTGNNRIQVFDQAGKFVRTWGGHGQGQGTFDAPQDIAIDPQGRVVVADTWHGLIQIFQPDGTFITQFGNPPGQAIGRDPGQFYGPRAVDCGADGAIFVCDTGNSRVQKFSPEGKHLLSISSWQPPEMARQEFKEPVGLACGGDEVFVADTGNKRVVVFGQDGLFRRSIWVFGDWTKANLVSVEPHLAVTPEGAFWLTSSPDGWVQGFAADGQMQHLFYGPTHPKGLAVGPDRLFISEASAGKVTAIQLPAPAVLPDATGQ